jgi:hypothetical protein
MLVLGWKEYVALPDLGVPRLKAKIDTGARTSVLDVQSYDLREGPGGLVAVLRLALSKRHPGRLTVLTAPVQRLVVVSNSGGVREQRPLLETTLQLGPVRKRIALTVTNRAGMRFRMLLGRKALEGDFLVDVHRKYLMRGQK